MADNKVTVDKEGPIKKESQSIMDKAIQAISDAVTGNSGGTGKVSAAITKRNETLKNI